MRDYDIQTIESLMNTRREKKHEIQTKKFYLLKNPRYNLRSLATAAKDVLHVYGGRGGGKATNQLHPLCLPSMVWEPGRHLTEILAGTKL